MSVLIDKGTISLGENLSIRSAERVLREWIAGPRSGPIEVDLSALNFVEVGAGWRLGNAISAWSRHGAVTVRVPEPGDFSGKWFKVFTRSGLGLALAAHRVSVQHGSENITKAVQDYYRYQGRVMTANNNVVVSELDRRVELRDPDAFAEEFGKWAPHVGLESIDSAPRVKRVSFLSMIREAITNVQDHAYRSPWSASKTRLSYASLRRYEKLSTASGEGSLDRYLAAVEVPENMERLGWIEIVAIDDGCGVAARQSQSLEVYSAESHIEDEALVAALTSGISVKPRTRDASANGDPGYGFTYIADGLRRYQAYAELRTGRRSLTLDASGSQCDGFVIREDSLGWMPGTALHVIFPLNSPQLRMQV